MHIWNKICKKAYNFFFYVYFIIYVLKDCQFKHKPLFVYTFSPPFCTYKFNKNKYLVPFCRSNFGLHVLVALALPRAS